LKSKAVLAIMLTLLFIGMFILTFDIQLVEASGTIYIKADGSVEGTTDISNVDNVTYTFTDNIKDEIIIERDNIVVDGAGYTLQGIGALHSIGIDLSGRNNVTIKNMKIEAFMYGIWLNNSSNDTISGNNLTNNMDYSIYLYESSNNTLSGNEVINNYDGFWLEHYSNRNIISGNNIVTRGHGIILEFSFYNNISDNTIRNNEYDGIRLDASFNNSICRNNISNNSRHGIWFHDSRDNILRKNNITNNTYNFGIWGFGLLSHFNDVDVSNTVDGKPIHYWTNRQDMTVPLDAGYVALVNCTRITVQNLNITSNEEGILLAYTTNSTITENDLANNWDGIYLYDSSNNSIYGNKITNNEYNGIILERYGCKNNIVSGNNIANNGDGILLHYYPYNNTITGNNIINNYYGIYLDGSSNNKFYHNNFINNEFQVGKPTYDESKNIWDDGYPSGGNYWSNYTGVDYYSGLHQNETASDGLPLLLRDGIGDTPYFIDENNQDNYPLMGMFKDFKATPEHHVQTICSHVTTDFRFNGTAISFDATSQNGTMGFCRICIPKALMNVSAVIVESTQGTFYMIITWLPCSNSTHSYLYFGLNFSDQEVIIIPEFPSFLILPPFMVATLLTVIVYRRKHSM